MDEHVKKIEDYIIYRERIQYKKLLGYSISPEDFKKLETLKEEATSSKYYIKEEIKRIKKLVKDIK